MTKADLIEKVQSSRPDLSKRQVSELVDVVFEHLAKAIRKDKRFSMPGFGTFTVKRRAGRVGRAQLPMAELSLALGGHVRVGLEDNLYLSKGVLAKGSGELVERAVALAREAGREPATPREARALLGISHCE